MNEIFTIGHSNHPIDHFIGLLARHGITALADVRSSPYSKYVPQYNRERLKDSLEQARIKYIFLGEELGARSKNPECYDARGKVVYERLSEDTSFKKGIERLFNGMKQFRIALMCAEKDPLACHRAVLVARKIYERGNVDVEHILETGDLESHADMEQRMLKESDSKRKSYNRQGGLFDSNEDKEEELAIAYQQRGEIISYKSGAILREETKSRRAA